MYIKIFFNVHLRKQKVLNKVPFLVETCDAEIFNDLLPNKRIYQNEYEQINRHSYFISKHEQ